MTQKPQQWEKHSTYCNCIKCAVPIINPFPNLPLKEWKQAMLKRALEHFGPDIHEKWTGRRTEDDLLQAS